MQLYVKLAIKLPANGLCLATLLIHGFTFNPEVCVNKLQSLSTALIYMNHSCIVAWCKFG